MLDSGDTQPLKKGLRVIDFMLFFSFIFYFPFFADPNSLAKAYFLYFASLFLFLNLIRNRSDIHFSYLALWWFALAAAFSVSLFLCRDPASATILLIFMLVVGAFLLLVSDKAFKDPNFVINAIWSLALVAVLYAVLGLYQYHDFLLHGQRPTMLIPSFLPSTGVRVAGPIGQPNFQATVMLIGLCCVAYLYKMRLSVTTQCERWGTGLISILLLLNFFLTESRAGYFSLIIAFVLLYVYGRYRFRLNGECLFSKQQVAAAFLVCFFSWGLYWFVVQGVASAIGPDVVQQAVGRDGSIYNRLNNWMTAVLVALDHPLLGVGLDNYKSHLAEYQIRAHGLTKLYYEDLIYTRWVHNEYLQVLAEGGLLGFTAMTGFLVAAARGVWHNLKTTTTPCFVFVPLALVPLLVHGGFEWPLRFAPLLATLLLLIALSLPPTDRGYRFSLATPLRKGVLSFLCLGLIGVGAWALYWDMEAGVLKRHAGDKRLMLHNLERLERLADHPVTALTILRQGVHPYLNYAIRENDIELARYLVPIIQRNIHLEGASWQWHNLAHLQLTAGYLDASRASVKRAIDLNPIYEPSWQLLRHLDRLNAVEQTGRPMEDFLPPQKQQSSGNFLQ